MLKCYLDFYIWISLECSIDFNFDNEINENFPYSNTDNLNSGCLYRYIDILMIKNLKNKI